MPNAPIRTVEGRAYPWGAENVDTDLIIPAHWLKTTRRTGLGRGVFEAVRADPDNVFDDPRYFGAPTLIAGENFGCGSSREHAAWALAEFGVRAVIAPSFSDIFSGNAFKNGILTVELPQQAVDRLVAVAREHPIAIDLETMTVTTPFQDRFDFALDPFRRHCLMEGLDEIGLTLAKDTAISNFETRVATQRPWIAVETGHESTSLESPGRT
ncbi:3-isopropylmalate dehydratase small subunit [Sphingosinithalassobacter sp. LHW66-3]|uniref:3-isopropylmalate dehydratase small subunit n=1 Tax=Sphingosinithalassobacter sp. LHW66-3 TaxID=3424718 RepID=UPI003D6BB2EA